MDVPQECSGWKKTGADLYVMALGPWIVGRDLCLQQLLVQCFW